LKKHFSKIFISFVVIIYVMSTVGISVFSHYCGGELEEIALFAKPTSCCGEEEEVMDDGCCKNEMVHLSFQKDFTFSQLIKDVKAPELVLAIFNFQSLVFNLVHPHTSLVNSNIEFQPPKLVQSNIVSCSVIRI